MSLQASCDLEIGKTGSVLRSVSSADECCKLTRIARRFSRLDRTANALVSHPVGNQNRMWLAPI